MFTYCGPLPFVPRRLWLTTLLLAAGGVSIGNVGNAQVLVQAEASAMAGLPPAPVTVP